MAPTLIDAMLVVTMLFPDPNDFRSLPGQHGKLTTKAFQRLDALMDGKCVNMAACAAFASESHHARSAHAPSPRLELASGAKTALKTSSKCLEDIVNDLA